MSRVLLSTTTKRKRRKIQYKQNVVNFAIGIAKRDKSFLRALFSTLYGINSESTHAYPSKKIPVQFFLVKLIGFFVYRSTLDCRQ